MRQTVKTRVDIKKKKASAGVQTLTVFCYLRIKRTNTDYIKLAFFSLSLEELGRK